MHPRWLLRMAKLAHRPPSETRVKLVFGTLALCFVLFAIEYFVGWPDWLTADLPSSRMRP